MMSGLYNRKNLALKKKLAIQHLFLIFAVECKLSCDLFIFKAAQGNTQLKRNGFSLKDAFVNASYRMNQLRQESEKIQISPSKLLIIEKYAPFCSNGFISFK